MVKTGDESSTLAWLWRPEKPEFLNDDTVKGSVMTVNQLLEQKAVTNDTSDHLWYLTRYIIIITSDDFSMFYSNFIFTVFLMIF